MGGIVTQVLVAPDSFKGSLPAQKVAHAIARGINRAYPNLGVVEMPLSDGGEGLVDVLCSGLGGQKESLAVTGPLGQAVTATYGLIPSRKLAVIEMAEASGLPLVPGERRNPLITTTYGTGELLKKVIRRGYRDIILGIGGSATVDGGVGMAQALGVKFLDSRGQEIGFGGGALGDLDRIDASSLVAEAQDVRVRVCCDVSNPLVGQSGAARVYGPQKGATPEMVEVLEKNLTHLAAVIKRDMGKDLAALSGAGAAGGLGAGLVAFLDATLVNGIKLVLELLDARSALNGVDLVITGEGQVDEQTLYGKVPAGIAKLAKEQDIPVVALAGSLACESEKLAGGLFAGLETIARGPADLAEMMDNAEMLIEDAAFRLIKLLVVGASLGTRFEEGI